MGTLCDVLDRNDNILLSIIEALVLKFLSVYFPDINVLEKTANNLEVP